MYFLNRIRNIFIARYELICMDKNRFHYFRESYSFDTVKNLINNIPKNLASEYDISESDVTDAEFSIISGIKWEKINRGGEYVRGENQFVTYEYERPEVEIRIYGDFKSYDTVDKMQVKIKLFESDEFYTFLIKDGIIL